MSSPRWNGHVAPEEMPFDVMMSDALVSKVQCECTICVVEGNDLWGKKRAMRVVRGTCLWVKSLTAAESAAHTIFKVGLIQTSSRLQEQEQ